MVIAALNPGNYVGQVNYDISKTPPLPPPPPALTPEQEAALTPQMRQMRQQYSRARLEDWVQRTKVNTEVTFLFLRYLFDDLHYRRVEWKCDNLNERSKRAALRLGFNYEGLFRKHMVVKGKNRDTAWFAMLDEEWPHVKANFETYLSNDGLSLTKLNQ